jgi:hypothetical protein
MRNACSGAQCGTREVLKPFHNLVCNVVVLEKQNVLLTHTWQNANLKDECVTVVMTAGVRGQAKSSSILSCTHHETGKCECARSGARCFTQKKSRCASHKRSMKLSWRCALCTVRRSMQRAYAMPCQESCCACQGQVREPAAFCASDPWK